MAVVTPSAEESAAQTAEEAWRRQQRGDLIGRSTALTEEAFRNLSKRVVDQVDKTLAGLWDRKFGLYWPRRREIGLFPLVRRILEAGGVAALRAPSNGGGEMEFRAWTPGDPLATGDMHLSFPRDGPLVAPDVVFVPLVGFDGRNFRLGYGGGSYNRALARAPRPLSIGVGFEFMRLDTVCPLPDDIGLDMIVSEAGRFPRPGTFD